ncbi:hypothetical protein PspLS_10611 [Pyricularia sp. CBS 133598]|nr:hypothetical protein PspLS_10611 [Pyricularia sp. CBS 133598]
MIPDNLVWTKAQLMRLRHAVLYRCMLSNYLGIRTLQFKGFRELGLDCSLPTSSIPCLAELWVGYMARNLIIAMMVLWRSTAPARHAR